MAKDPAFLFYDADAAKDVAHMNRLERGGYFDIMQAQRKFGRLSMEQIHKVLGRDFKKCWSNLSLIMVYNEGYYIPWVEDSIQKRKDYSLSRSANRTKKKSAEVAPRSPEQIKGAREPLVQRMADEWKEVIQGYAFSVDYDYPALLDFARFISDQLKILLEPSNKKCVDTVVSKWKLMIMVIDDHPSWRKKSLLNLAKFNKQEIYGSIGEPEEKKMVI